MSAEDKKTEPKRPSGKEAAPKAKASGAGEEAKASGEGEEAKHEEAGCCFEAACERQGAVSGWSCERQEAASGSSFGSRGIDAQRLGVCITRDCK